jgi:Tfp pilus assembly protein PilN
MCVRDVDFACFYDFPIRFRNCSDSVQIESVLCLSLRTFFKLFYFRWKKKMKQQKIELNPTWQDFQSREDMLQTLKQETYLNKKC